MEPSNQKDEKSTTEERCWNVPLNDLPHIKSYWRHCSSGGFYRVIITTNTFATNKEFVPTVVYTDSDGEAWSRPLEQFLARFKFFGLGRYYNQELIDAMANNTPHDYVCLGYSMEKLLYAYKGELYVRWGDGDDKCSSWNYKEQLERIERHHAPTFLSPELIAAERYYDHLKNINELVKGINEMTEYLTSESLFATTEGINNGT